MPPPHSNKAPRFTGDPLTITTFLESYASKADKAGIVDAGKRIQGIIGYVDPETRDLWRTLDEYVTPASWANFKAAVEKLYEKMQDPLDYTSYDLEAHITEWAHMGIFTLAHLDKYTLRFNMFARNLLKQKVVSEAALATSYIRAFSPNFRSSLGLELRIKFPAPTRATLAEVQETARSVLTVHGAGQELAVNPIFKHESLDPSLQEVRQLSVVPVTAAPVAPKMETQDALSQALLKLTAFLENSGNSSNQRNQGHRAGQQLYVPRGAQVTCHFCGFSGHYQTDCEIRQQYLIEKKCLLEPNTLQITFANGGRIFTRDGTNKTMKTRIDEWLAANPAFNQPQRAAQIQTVSFVDNSSYQDPFVGVETDPVYVTDSHANEVWNDGNPAVAVYVTTRRGETGNVTVDMPARQRANPANRREPVAREAAPTVQAPAVPMLPPQQPPVQQAADAPRVILQRPANDLTQPAQQPFVPGPQRNRQPNQNPAFRNRAPVENDKNIDEVFQKVKEATVTLTVEQIYSISPDVRRQVREWLSVKRVAEANANSNANRQPQATNIVETFYDAVDEEEISRVAVHFMALRTVHTEVGGRTVQALLDDGSTVCIMSKQFWERLPKAHPMDLTRILHMETADGNVHTSQGVLENLPVTIGGIKYLLQVQVVDKAPFEFLLGRPFSAVAQTTVINDSDGNQTLVLRDTDGDRVVQINTQRRAPKQCMHHGHTINSGF